jgi:hypothetical protein
MKRAFKQFVALRSLYYIMNNLAKPPMEENSTILINELQKAS